MRRKHLTLLALLGLACLVALALRRGERRTAGGQWPVNLAHRGASKLAPENTLEAFRMAVESGAGGLELDVHLTRDGHVVVIHDETVERTTGGKGVVAEMTFEELRVLDAGHSFSPDGGRTRPYRGARIPTLAEVLREFPDVVLNIDMKARRSGIEAAVLGVLREAGAAGRALVVSSHHGSVRRFRRLSGGGISTGASRRETGVFYLLSRLRLERLLHPAYDALQVPLRYRGIPLVTRHFVEAAHARGVRVDAWTINEPDVMRRLLDLGVDVIMTDRPWVLAAVLGEREAPEAQERMSSTTEATPKSV